MGVKMLFPVLFLYRTNGISTTFSTKAGCITCPTVILALDKWHFSHISYLADCITCPTIILFPLLENWHFCHFPYLADCITYPTYLWFFPLASDTFLPLEWPAIMCPQCSISGTRHRNDIAMQPSYLTELLFYMYPQRHRLMITAKIRYHAITSLFNAHHGVESAYTTITRLARDWNLNWARFRAMSHKKIGRR